MIIFKKTIFMLFKYYRIRLYKNYKKTIRFRRFYNKMTKFKRKSLYKIHHKNKWIIYSQIWKFWTEDFQINKYKIKFQLNKNIFNLEIIIYNYEFWKLNKFKNFRTFNYFLINFLNKKIFYKFANKYTFFKNITLTYTYIKNLNIDIKNLFLNKINLIPIYLNTSNCLFSLENIHLNLKNIDQNNINLNNWNFQKYMNIEFIEFIYNFYILLFNHIKYKYNILNIIYINILKLNNFVYNFFKITNFFICN